MDEQIFYETMLSRGFYTADALTLARALIGKVLVHRTERGLTAGIISETEAYMGVTDKASHAYNGRRTTRTETMYLPAGHAYVYLIYGIYSCMNITAAEEGNPEAVLIRGVVPLVGFDRMLADYADFSARLKKRFSEESYRKKPYMLTNGPGKLCAAMAIDRSLDTVDLCRSDRRIFVSDIGIRPLHGISESPRIGIAYAEEAALFPWRFTANRPSEMTSTVQTADPAPNAHNRFH